MQIFEWLIKKLNVHDYEFFSILQITYMGDGSIISAIAVPPCSEPGALLQFLVWLYGPDWIVGA